MDKKYCSNCGVENEFDSGFCINCGTSLTGNPVEEVKTEVSVKPKKKKGKGCLIALIIILLIAGLIVGGIFLYKKLTYFEDPFETSKPVSSLSESNSFIKNLDNDYANGVITKDKYYEQLAYSIYEPAKLDSKYSSLKLDYANPSDLLDDVLTSNDGISYETYSYVIGKYGLDYVEWNVDDAATTKKEETAIKKLGATDSHVNKLDHVLLSSNGNFLVYYTTEGINATDEKRAKAIAKYAESVIKEYKSKFNFDYKYEPVLVNYSICMETLYDKTMDSPFDSSYCKARKLLKRNNIDEKYLKTAMPIYIIYTDNDNTTLLGGYNRKLNNAEYTRLNISGILTAVFPEEAGEVVKIETDLGLSTYAFPYFYVSSESKNMDDIELVTRHELFHHYQRYFCGDGEYKECSGGLFVMESSANLAALSTTKINHTNALFNGHSIEYMLDTEKSVDKVWNGNGYASYVFIYNYSEIVKNGTKKVFRSLKKDDPLKYLYKQSDGKYKDVMLTMAEKNLTREYKNKLLLPVGGDYDEYPKNHINTNGQVYNNDTVDYSAMHYYYINPNNYDDGIQLNISKTSFETDNLYLLMFITKGDKYELVYTHNLNDRFVINMKDFKEIGDLTFAIVNTSYNTNINYLLNISYGAYEPTVTPKSLKLDKISKNGGKNRSASKIVCSKVESEEYIKSTYQVLVSFDNKDEVNDFYVKGTVEMEDNAIFKIAKGVTTGAVFLLKQKYKEEFGKITLRTYDEGNRYIILGRVKDDYYTAIKSSFNTESTSKEDIFNAIQNEGFTCQYQ